MQNVIGLLKNITAITERRRSTLELFWQQTNGLIDALSQRRGAGVSGNRCRSRRFRRLGAQELEPRALLATFTVTNTNDSGTGSLRWAFDQADASSSADTIDFSSFFANTGRVIHLTSASVNLNSGTGTTTINGPGPNFLAIQNDVDLTDVYGDTHALTVHGSSMVLNNVSILNSGGGYRLSGGAISAGNSNITVNNCWLQSNSATNFGSGGAIYSGGSGSLTITDSLLANNQAYFDGGCVAVSGGVALTISGSSLYGNSAFGYGGGGVMFYGTSSATIVNTTLSGNRGYGGGGGIRVEATGTVTIRDSTIANNSAYQGAFNQPYGGGIYVRAGTVQLSNTLLAGNGIGPEPSDVTGTITSLGNNGISTTAGATGFSNADLRNVNLNIGALQVTTQNGRWQAYHPLLSGSPALNAGTSHGTTDQRGFLRQSGSAQDIGSVEMQYPTQILLSSASVAEVVGTTSGVLAIGTLSATDADSNSHTFSMASGTGSTDNNRFEISGTTLRIKQGQTLDHELTPTLSVRIRATDANGLFFERVFSITVTNVNESPTDLNLSSSLISSHPTPQMVIGTFSTVDPDFGDTFTYSFVSGTGATDNNAFLTSGNQLKPNPTYDFTTKNSYSIRLKTMDPAGLSIEKVFTITVDDISPNVSTTSFLSAGTLGANSTSLTATFSESVIGGNLPASYQLQRAGADGLLGTADDSLITVTSATVSKNTATLNFAGLVEDVYRLTVKATITDAAGNLLDGDSNGSAGGNWSRDFVVGLPNDSTRRTLLPPRLGQAGADFGYSVAVDGNYRVVGAPYVDFNGVTDVGMAYVYEATTGVLITTLANPTPAANDAFGLSVAISGNMVVVGAYRDDTSATDSGSAYVFNATTGALIATLANPTPAADDNFAFGVAISGTTAVVGSYADDTTGTDSGSAYVFNATTGAYIRTVANPTPAAGDRFGLNAGVSGNTIVVGAYQDDTGGTNSGSAYVFNATTGAHVTTLGNPTPGADENFGYSLAVSGNTVVVGAYQESTTASKAGSAYVFNVTTGALITALANPTPAPDDNFGISVAISGNTVVVGAYQDDTGAADSGSAYIFDATTGSLISTLVNPTPGVSDFFGWSVALSGNTVIVGAVLDDTNANNGGSAYVFNATSGALTATLTHPTPATNDQFGFSVAFSNDMVAVGAYLDDTGATDSGSVYVFNATTGTLLRTLANPTPATNDQFGYSVAISGNTVVVGAYFDDTGASDSGTAYVFDLTTGALIATLTNPTPAADDRFGFTVGIAGNTAVVGAYLDDTTGTDSGSAYVFNATTGALMTTLANPTPAGNDQFGRSLDVSGNTILVSAFGDDVNVTNGGSAYVFSASNGALVATLSNPAPGVGDLFGYSVAISGNTAVVGAYFDDAGAVDSGSAYVFNATTGSLISTLVNPTPAAGDLFGNSVAVSGNTVVVGAGSDDTGAIDSGSAFVFNATTGNLFATVANPTPAANDFFGRYVDVQGGTVVVSASNDDTQNQDQGAVYVLPLESNRSLAGPGGLSFDVAGAGFGAGQLIQGTGNAFDGLNRLRVSDVGFVPASPSLNSLVDGGRTIVTPTVTMSSLNVSREVTIPVVGTQDFARTIDILTNSTGSAITVPVRVLGNLGSDAATTVFATSDGDLVVEPTDLWFATDDANATGGTPAIVHLLHGPFGLQPTSVNVIDDNVQWTYNLTVAPGETKRLASFTVLGTTRQQAINAANALVTSSGFGGQAAAFLTAGELASLTNFHFNVAPTELRLSPSTIIENNSPNVAVGTLTTTDPNLPEGDAFTYSLVTGTGDDNNASFAVSGNKLFAKEAFDFESKNTYSVRVRTTDTGGLFFEQSLTITIADQLDGTVGSDAFVLTYSSSAVSITRSINGGAPVSQGTFSLTTPLSINGQGGTDSVRVVGTSGVDTIIVNSSTALTVNGASLILTSIENRTLAGAAGSDIYKFDSDAPLGLFTLDEAGGGTDTIDLSLTTAVDVSLNLGSAASQLVHTNLSLILGSASVFENAIGGSRNDTLTGNLLANSLNGGPGNDTLNGATGHDTLVGGDGNDTYSFATATAAGNNIISEVGTTGVDTISFSAITSPTSNVSINLGLTAFQRLDALRFVRLDGASAIENVIGGSGNDTIIGNALANNLNGGPGNDTLNGATGHDTLVGGHGDDTYTFAAPTAAGNSIISEVGTTGVDTINFSSITSPTSNVSINLGLTAFQRLDALRFVRLDGESAIENVIGGSGNDTITGNALANILTGNAGNDTLTGGAGNDSLIGGLGDDTYVFGLGSAGEADTVTEATSAGTDTLDFSTLTTSVVLNLGTSAVQTVHANRTLMLNSASTFDNAVGGAGNDTLIGNSLNNRLTGINGHDILIGNAGNDVLLGLAGRDILIGGTGTDTIDGGIDDDILIAGLTTSDALFNKLDDLRTEWISANLYATRTTTLRTGVGSSVASLKAKINVLNDTAAIDILTGGSGSDWYFRAIDDVITDLLAAESVDVL